jgi:hypothetical protein
MAKHITLTHKDAQEIDNILSTITTVPSAILQNTQGYLYQTLENGNPLNRLVKDPKTGNIIGFLAVEDKSDDKGNKIAYL